MVIVIRAIQAVLLLFTVGAAVTAFTLGLMANEQANNCSLTAEDVTSACAAALGVQAQATATFGIGVAGAATAIGAVALNGMARPTRITGQQEPAGLGPQQGPQSGYPQVRHHSPGPQQGQSPQQQQTGPHLGGPPYGPPPGH